MRTSSLLHKPRALDAFATTQLPDHISNAFAAHNNDRISISDPKLTVSRGDYESERPKKGIFGLGSMAARV